MTQYDKTIITQNHGMAHGDTPEITVRTATPAWLGPRIRVRATQNRLASYFKIVPGNRLKRGTASRPAFLLPAETACGTRGRQHQGGLRSPPGIEVSPGELAAVSARSPRAVACFEDTSITAAVTIAATS